SGIAGRYRRHGIGGAAQRSLGKLARMGITGRLAGDRPQAEALVGIEVRGLQPAVVEDQRLALAIFAEKLAVIGSRQRFGHDPPHGFVRNVESLDEAGSHLIAPKTSPNTI